jgi:hypothetical protein
MFLVVLLSTITKFIGTSSAGSKGVAKKALLQARSCPLY